MLGVITIGSVAGCRVLGRLEVTSSTVPTNSTAVTRTVRIAISEAADLMFGN